MSKGTAGGDVLHGLCSVTRSVNRAGFRVL